MLTLLLRQNSVEKPVHWRDSVAHLALKHYHQFHLWVELLLMCVHTHKYIYANTYTENIRVPFCQLTVREFQQKFKGTTWIHRLLSLISNPEGWLLVFLEQVITSGRSASSILHSRWGEGKSLWRCSWASNGAALTPCTPHTRCWPRTKGSSTREPLF